MYFYGIGDCLTLTEDFEASLPYQTRWLNREALACIDVDVEGISENENGLEFFITIPKGAVLKIVDMKLLKTGKDRDFLMFKNVSGWEDGPGHILILRKHLLPEFPAEIVKQKTFEDIAYRRMRRRAFEEFRYKAGRCDSRDLSRLKSEVWEIHNQGSITDEQRLNLMAYVDRLYERYVIDPNR